MQARISMITLGVTDLQKSVEFYKLGAGVSTDEVITRCCAFYA